jgi:pilus assembly protein Flp/PilA
MLQLLTTFQAWYATRAQDERGATAVEYGLLVALIAAVIVVTVGILGGKIEAAFTTITSNLK